MKRFLLQASLALGLGLSVLPIAHAQLLGPTPYLQASDSPFNGTAFDYFYLEDFEDGALNTPGVAASAGTPLAPATFTDSVDADDGAVDGLGARGNSWYIGTTETLVFTFDANALGALPTHAGLVWTDVGNNSGVRGINDVLFEAFDANGASLGTVGPALLGDGSVEGGTAEDRFFGVIHAEGVSRLQISVPGSQDWEADHLQYGRITPAAVPEPSIAVVFLVAGVSALLARRRK